MKYFAWDTVARRIGLNDTTKKQSNPERWKTFYRATN